MQKIGIMGTHGTGKTTLAFELACKYKKANPEMIISILPEIARKCPFLINEGGTIQGQRWIYHKQMTSELEASNSDILICDRTIIDNLAYSKVLGFEYIVENYLESAVLWLCTYWKLYWLRPGYPILADGVRSVSVKFQTEVDFVLDGWISEYLIPVEKIKRERKVL